MKLPFRVTSSGLGYWAQGRKLLCTIAVRPCNSSLYSWSCWSSSFEIYFLPVALTRSRMRFCRSCATRRLLRAITWNAWRSWSSSCRSWAAWRKRRTCFCWTVVGRTWSHLCIMCSNSVPLLRKAPSQLCRRWARLPIDVVVFSVVSFHNVAMPTLRSKIRWQPRTNSLKRVSSSLSLTSHGYASITTRLTWSFNSGGDRHRVHPPRALRDRSRFCGWVVRPRSEANHLARYWNARNHSREF